LPYFSFVVFVEFFKNTVQDLLAPDLLRDFLQDFLSEFRP